jgi:hypothetical protein
MFVSDKTVTKIGYLGSEEKSKAWEENFGTANFDANTDKSCENFPTSGDKSAVDGKLNTHRHAVPKLRICGVKLRSLYAFILCRLNKH